MVSSPAAGACECTRHRKSCASSTGVGALNGTIRKPSGSTSWNTARIVPSLPLVSMPCSTSSTRRLRCACSRSCRLSSSRPISDRRARSASFEPFENGFALGSKWSSEKGSFFLPSSKYGTRKSSRSACFAMHTLRGLRLPTLNGLKRVRKTRRAVAPLQSGNGPWWRGRNHARSRHFDSGQLLLQQFIDLSRVGLTLGRLHRLADQRVERLFLAGAEFLDRFLVRGEHFVDDRFERAGIRNLLQAFRLDDAIGGGFVGGLLFPDGEEDFLRDLVRDRAVGDTLQQQRELPGR